MRTTTQPRWNGLPRHIQAERRRSRGKAVGVQKLQSHFPRGLRFGPPAGQPEHRQFAKRVHSEPPVPFRAGVWRFGFAHVVGYGPGAVHPDRGAPRVGADLEWDGGFEARWLDALRFEAKSPNDSIMSQIADAGEAIEAVWKQLYKII